MLGLSSNHRHHEPINNDGSDCEAEKESRKLLHEAINKLPENQRIAFVLNKFDDQSYKQVAEIMNLSVSAVESLIFRAKTNLQSLLAPHFPEYKKN
jgi:RNA polymerase sigma-70 factor (ECF subfamily)